MNFQKIKAYRSQAYLDFIKSKPCCNCGTPSNENLDVVPAHQRVLGSAGTGMKPPDIFAIPLCTDCHRREHGGAILFESREQIAMICLKLVAEYMSLNKGRKI